MSRQSSSSAWFLSFAFVSALCLTAHADDGPIKVFLAKKIITMTPSRPSATAVAVRDGKILSVGSLEDLKPWTDKFPHEVDRTFVDKILMPGFIEPHGHPLIGGLLLNFPLITYLPTDQPYGPPFPGVKTPEKALELIKKYVSEAKHPDETVFIWGWDVVAMGGKHLDKTMLDEISKTQPIIVWDASEHFGYANSAQLKKSRITDAALKVNGVKAGPDGQPSGQFLGTTAMKLLIPPALAPYMTPERAVPRMRSLLDLSVKGGITTQSELAFGLFSFDVESKLMNMLFDQPDVPTRCVVVCDGASATSVERQNATRMVRSFENQSSDLLMFRGVKFFSDDSFVGLGMVVDNPGYIDGHKGIYILSPGREIHQAMLPWWKEGFHIHVHSNGNGGNASTIQALADLQGAQPRFDHRFTVEHYGITTPELSRRLKALGGIVSTNPYYVYYRGELDAPMFGTDRAYSATPLKSNLAAGLTVSLHSDTPIGPARPLEWVWIAVNRIGQSGKVLDRDEQIPIEAALRMITIDAAYTLGIDDKTGSIQAGKFADFTVLEEDPLVVERSKIKDIAVWGTVLGGRPQPISAIKPQPSLVRSP